MFQLGVPVVSCPQYNFSVRINRGTAEPYWSTGRALLDSSADWYREQPTLMSLWPLPVTLGPSPLAHPRHRASCPRPLPTWCSNSKGGVAQGRRSSTLSS